MKVKTHKLFLTILCILFANLAAIGQQNLSLVEVQGIVYDDKGEEAIGVTITIKDRTGAGTVTNIEGKFTMKVPLGSTLLFSYVGFSSQEYVVLKEEKNIRIRLQVAAHELTEAVVTGVGGTQRRISISGAVTSVDTKDLQTPATSVTNMLAGRVPGVIARLNSGEPGENTSEFWIRGIGTFGGGTGALVLIDGIEGSLNNIDPADIESFSILKDASATAVYGVRGANGVILVTTKRGTTDKLHIKARANVRLSYLNRLPDYIGANEYAGLANEAQIVRGDNPLYSEAELEIIKHGLDRDMYPDVDWQDELIRKTSWTSSYYMSASGGGTLANYFMSLGYTNEGSAFKKDNNNQFAADVGFDKLTYRMNLDINMTPTTKVYLGVDGEYTKKTEPGMVANSGDTYGTKSPATAEIWFAQLRLTPLLMPTRYSSGEFPAFDDAEGGYSPYIMLNNTGTGQREYNKNLLTLSLTQDFSPIIKGLTWRAQVALTNKNWVNEKRFIRPGLWRANRRNYQGELIMTEVFQSKTPSYSNWERSDRVLHFESTLNYETLIDKNHRLTGLIYYYMTDDARTASHFTSSLKALPYKSQGISGRATYGYRNTYFTDFNFGYTGSANFKKGDRFGFFPAFAVGWVPTSYDIVTNKLPWLDFFKLRFSYGLVGNDEISGTSRFPYLTKIDENASTTWGFDGAGYNGLEELEIGANNLRWEKSKKTNFGIEGRLFKEKVDFTVDFYNDQRDGIFQRRQKIPAFAGLTNIPYSNVGKMRSYGSDGNISYFHVFNKNLNMTLRANYTYSTNEIQNYEQAYSPYPYKSYNGFPYNAIRGYIALGLFEDEEDVINSPVQNFGQTVMPGDIKYKDVNGDGKIDSNDEVPLSYWNTPRLQYGIGYEMKYKNFTAGIRLTGTGKTDFFWTHNPKSFDSSKYASNGVGYIPFYEKNYGNVLTIAYDQNNRWTPAWYSGDPSTENPNARFPRLSYGNNSNNNKISTYWQGDASYLRISEVNLNYNLSLGALRHLGISSIDISLIGTNLHSWDDVKIFDPDLARYVGQAYPIPATYTLQLFFNF